MTLLIKGASLPRGCRKCPLSEWSRGGAFEGCNGLPGKGSKELLSDGEFRPEWCPLIELPPHGRLIDADKLHDEVYDQAKFRRDPVTGDYVSPTYIRISEMLRRIIDQPTAIEAEEVSDDEYSD